MASSAVPTEQRMLGGSARIVLIGGGKMGEAILSGWLAAQTGHAGAWHAGNFVVVEPGDERRAYLSATYGVPCIADVAELQGADVVLLAVKPQVMMDVLKSMEPLAFVADALCISIAAGLSTAKLEAALPVGTHLVRVMPNIALLVGAGATTLCAGAWATDDDAQTVRDLFGCIGQAFIVDEDMMDATGAINGCGPAYVAALIEALADAGDAQGLDRALAEGLATQTVLGTATLMVERGQSAEKTRIDVCSPGGTTLAALDAMEQSGFTASLAAGVEAAIRRSEELGA